MGHREHPNLNLDIKYISVGDTVVHLQVIDFTDFFSQKHRNIYIVQFSHISHL